MLKYILKRIGLAIIMLLGVSFIIYFLIRLMPMDFIEQKFATQLAQAESTAVQEKVDQLKDQLGLRVVYVVYEQDADGNFVLDENGEKIILKRVTVDKYTKASVMEEYGLTEGDVVWLNVKSFFSGYVKWLGKAMQGDFGDSLITGKSVVETITDKMGISFVLALISTILQFAIAIPLGIVSATKQYGVMDYTVTVLAMMGISLPSFFFAALLTRVFSLQLGWLPLSGMTTASVVYDPALTSKLFSAEWFAYNTDVLLHLILPMVVLVVLSIGGLMRYTRTNMLEVLNSDYIRTARAKGLSEHDVIYKHAFRNTLIPLVTMLAGTIPGLFGGAMITETVFAIPGIGQMAYQSIVRGDINFVMAYNMFIAVLSILGTLMSDLMYAVVDPRVKIGK